MALLLKAKFVEDNNRSISEFYFRFQARALRFSEPKSFIYYHLLYDSNKLLNQDWLIL